MQLFHGSNVEVRQPRLLRSDRHLDFGRGFYLTSSLKQASRWATLTHLRRGQGEAQVSVYDFDEHLLDVLSVLAFDDANSEWLEFVAKNRGVGQGEVGYDAQDYDIITGPVANDQTMPTLQGFFAGIYTVEETLKRLQPQNLIDQYAFRTQKAIDALSFVKVVCL